MQIPSDCPHVKRWYDEMQKRDSVRKSMPTHMPEPETPTLALSRSLTCGQRMRKGRMKAVEEMRKRRVDK
jgi:hypothetical protein